MRLESSGAVGRWTKRYRSVLQQLPGVRRVHIGPRRTRLHFRSCAISFVPSVFAGPLTRTAVASMQPSEAGAAPPLVLSPRISRPIGARLARAGIACADLAGNCHVEHRDIYLHIEGRSLPPEPRARGLGVAGYNVLFALLADDGLLQSSVRAIESACGASRQAVSSTLQRLEAAGAIARRGRQRAWVPTRRTDVLRQWLAGYEGRVRPKLLIGHFVWPPTWSDDALLSALGDGTCWGGATAAHLLQGYYDPTERTAHIPADASVPSPLRVTSNATSTLTLLRQPAGLLWRAPTDTRLVHPLYAWAEMMVSPDDRAHDAARVLLEEYVPDLVSR